MRTSPITGRRVVGTAVGALALAGLTATPAFASGTGDATVSVLHAVPDTPVDVYVNDELTIDDFQPGDLAGPLTLPAGTYSVAIVAADAEDASEPVIGPADVPVEAGGNYTIVAHLNADGEPTATPFANDVSTTAAGEGRLTVRHTAAAPAVDVLAGGTAVVSGLTNPNEEVLNLPAGTISAAVAAAGTTEPVIGPADVNVAEGVNTIVYAWGSLEDDNLDLAIQTIDGLHGAPGGVNSGQAGLVATNDDTTGWAVFGGALALLAAALGVTTVARRRAAQR